MSKAEEHAEAERASIVLAIGLDRYRCKVSRSIQVRHEDGSDKRNHYVTRDFKDVIRCSCPDYRHRCSVSGGYCKHITALVAIGLI
jgi:hypothetical protein